MFQCALQKQTIFGYVNHNYDIVEDTDLVTWDEAVELWEKWKPKVVEQIKYGQSPEMVIWTACEDNTSYATDAYHVDHSTKVENDEFVERITKIIDPTKVSMGEPI